MRLVVKRFPDFSITSSRSCLAAPRLLADTLGAAPYVSNPFGHPTDSRSCRPTDPSRPHRKVACPWQGVRSNSEVFIQNGGYPSNRVARCMAPALYDQGYRGDSGAIGPDVCRILRTYFGEFTYYFYAVG